MEFAEFVRKPFTVEALEITEDNIEEIAEFVGVLRQSPKGPYIDVSPRLVPNILKVFPGYYLTRMGDNIRCYTKRAFEDQFTANSDSIQEWVNYMNGKSSGTFGKAPTPVDATA